MDEARARRMTNELVGNYIGKWKLTKYIGSGKSALVFKGDFDGQASAVKIFDPELIERFGKENQLQRIKRELLLKEKAHENLISIIDGGECRETGYLYVVMNFLEMSNLEDAIVSIPSRNICKIITQIASAAQFLESLGLCHRDIKPSNIAISHDYEKAILLDLGVLRPIGSSDVTDETSRQFIGTLRYSSPEFLLREEIDSIEGWRAVTFYQIGAVLHDLIMKKPIFFEYSEPFARLVNAVLEINPEINPEASDVSPSLVHLAKTCLIKDPKIRCELIKWDSFLLLEKSTESLALMKERVHQRQLTVQPGVVCSLEEQEARRRLQLQTEVLTNIGSIIRSVCIGNNAFPPMTVVTTLNQISIKYAHSEVHQLPLSLYLRFKISVMDIATKSISICYWSCVSNKDIDVQETPEMVWVPLFEGAFQYSLVRDEVETIAYTSLDVAQQVKKSDVVLLPLGDFRAIRGGYNE